MLKCILIAVSLLALARAQIPSLGWCPDYVPMANFDMGKFIGVWYEAERYFQILDPVSRCVAANYTKGPDGKFRVSNEVTNRFTGIKRVLNGEIRIPTTKTEEGKLHVKYTTVPLTPETQYVVLQTDYKSYAVLWSCSGIGPVNAQNAWVMTRARRPTPETIQKAYGVLDNYKISKTFFIKTNQEDCAWFNNEQPENTSKPIVEKPTAEEPVGEQQEAARLVNMRSAIAPEAPIPESAEPAIAQPEIIVEAKSQVKNVEPIEAVEKSVELAKSPISVPEVILNAADRAKEIVKKTIEEVQKFEPIEAIKETFDKPADKIQAALEKPVEKFQESFEKPIGQIKESFEKPIEQIKETFQNPLDKIKEVLNIPASEAKETLPNEAKVAEESKEKN